MGKAWRHPQLVMGHVVQQHPHRLAKRGGAAAHIHRHIKHLASGAAHQLSLRLHQLVMQPAQHAMPAARLVVLHQLGNAWGRICITALLAEAGAATNPGG
jgi:hypothetical protein